MAERVARRHRPNLRFGPNAWLLLGTSAGGAVSVGVFSVVFNLYIVSLGLSTGLLGEVLAAGTLGAALAVAPAGILADIWGRKQVLVLGGAVSGGATLAQCTVTTPMLIASFGFAAGVGSAAIAVTALPMLVEAARPAQRNAVLSAAGALALLGGAAGSALGGWLPAFIAPVIGAPVDSAPAYRSSLLLALGLAGITALPLLIWYREAPPASPWRRSLAGWTDPSWRRIAWRLALVAGTLGLGAGLVIPYMNLYFTRTLGVSLAAFGTLSAVSQLVLGFATMLAGALAARIHVWRIVIVTQALAIVVLLMLAFAPSPAVAMPAFVLRQALMDMATPVSEGWLIGRVGADQRATLASVLLIAQQAPWALASAAGGALQQQAGFRPGFLLTALLYVISLLFWITLFRREMRTENPMRAPFGILKDDFSQEAQVE